MWRGKETLGFQTWSVVLVLSTILKGIKFPPHKDHLKTLTTALRAATGRNFGRSKPAMGRDVNNEVFRRGAKGMGMVSTATWLVVLSNGMDLKEIRSRTSLVKTLGSNRQLRCRAICHGRHGEVVHKFGNGNFFTAGFEGNQGKRPQWPG